MNKTQRVEFFSRLQAANPHPTTELEYGSTFQLLIAVILSAQATDKGVNLATRQLFKDAPDAASMAMLGIEGLVPYIKSIGLYPTKSKNVIATCQILRDQYGGEVPEDRSALEALPGVGRKTANVVLNTAFGHPTMAVDTHIFRVSNRFEISTAFATEWFDSTKYQTDFSISKQELVNIHEGLQLALPTDFSSMLDSHMSLAE